MEVGIKNKKCMTVGEAETALSLHSGSLPVFATPAMIALMEATASESVAPLLEPGITSVGTRMDVSHLSADPTGVTVICESVLTECDGRKLVFDITVRDHFGIVGKGTHERFIVDTDSFMEKTQRKRGVEL